MVCQYVYCGGIFLYYQYLFDDLYGICAFQIEISAEKADHEAGAYPEYVPGIYEYDCSILYFESD